MKDKPKPPPSQVSDNPQGNVKGDTNPQIPTEVPESRDILDDLLDSPHKGRLKP